MSRVCGRTIGYAACRVLASHASPVDAHPRWSVDPVCDV